MWAKDGLFVDLIRADDGRLIFQGQHLSNGDEYEYALTVDAADVPTIVAALGGGADDDVVDLVALHAGTIVAAGEQTWLKALGITPSFWSRGDPPSAAPFAGLAAELAALGLTPLEVVLPGQDRSPLPLEGALHLTPTEAGFDLTTVDYGHPYLLGRATTTAEARALVLAYVSRPLPPPGVISQADVDRATVSAAQHYVDLRARVAADAGLVFNLPPLLPLDRIGALDGVQLFPYGTPYEHRSLPPYALRPESQLHRLITTQPVRVSAVVVPAWFGQPGGGIRLSLQAPGVGIRDLVVSGVLQRMQVTS